MSNVNLNDLYKIILGLVRFPFPQISRHKVAEDLLNLIEKSGYQISDELARALCCGSNGDEEAERILIEILFEKGV